MSGSIQQIGDPGLPDSVFTWQFQARGGSSWGGTLVANSAWGAPGDTLAGSAGSYLILSEEQRGTDLTPFGLEDGQVFIDWYWDQPSSRFLPTRNGPSLASGSAGLGSELDDAWDGLTWQPFGLGGALLADIPSRQWPGTVVIGSPGSDGFIGGPRNDTIDGGAGFDIVTYVGTLRSVTIGRSGDDILISPASGASQLDRIRNVEGLRFADGKVHFDQDASPAKAARLYLAALGREPDRLGLESWSAALDAGLPLNAVAMGFLGSPEFQQRYGALSDADYVDRLYLNVLSRTSDPGGREHWLGELARGQGRADLLVGFSESLEARGRNAGLLANGVLDYDDTMAFVARLYRATLDRDPDLAGAQNWSNALAAGLPVSSVVLGFTQSVEFQQRYGVASDFEFVDLLYRNALDRAPDAPGIANWTAALAAGMSRPDVVLGFAESLEHQIKLYTYWQDRGIIFAE